MLGILTATTAPGVDARCVCGGFLLHTPTGEPEHVDTCAELHPADAPCPDQRATHRTCPAPRPVPCDHPHRRPTPSFITTTCRADLPACCGCCG